MAVQNGVVTGVFKRGPCTTGASQQLLTLDMSSEHPKLVKFFRACIALGEAAKAFLDTDEAETQTESPPAPAPAKPVAVVAEKIPEPVEVVEKTPEPAEVAEEPHLPVKKRKVVRFDDSEISPPAKKATDVVVVEDSEAPSPAKLAEAPVKPTKPTGAGGASRVQQATVGQKRKQGVQQVEVVQTNIFPESEKEILPLRFEQNDFGTPRALHHPGLPALSSICKVSVHADPFEVLLTVDTSKIPEGYVVSRWKGEISYFQDDDIVSLGKDDKGGFCLWSEGYTAQMRVHVGNVK